MVQDDMIRRVWRELEPHLGEQGYDLIEVELGRQGRSPLLRLYIDKEGGITLDDCSAVSQLLGPVLDAADFFADSYALEVSSPGIDRPLRKPEDFERFAGEPVQVRSVAPVQGRKRFRGVLEGLRDGMVLVQCEGIEYEIHLENLEKARLDR